MGEPIIRQALIYTGAKFKLVSGKLFTVIHGVLRRKVIPELLQALFCFTNIPHFWHMENMLHPYYHADIVEAGIDEAGRGCYAGPVFAAAVILPKNFFHPLLNDSKQTRESDRYLLRDVIKKEAIAWAVASVDNTIIDSINILQATYEAMHQAIGKLKRKPKFLLIDGNRFRPYPRIKHECIIQGDGIYASIAAASILAKTYRDDYMIRLHREHPHYKWESNKGYGTAEHRAAIAEHGLCCYHRKSFNIMSPQMELSFENDTIEYDIPVNTLSAGTGNFPVTSV